MRKIIQRSLTGPITGDTRSLDYSSCRIWSSFIHIQVFPHPSQRWTWAQENLDDADNATTLKGVEAELKTQKDPNSQILCSSCPNR